MSYTTTEGATAADELDAAHQEFLAEIVHIDGKAAQRLFKTIAEAGDDATSRQGVTSSTA